MGYPNNFEAQLAQWRGVMAPQMQHTFEFRVPDLALSGGALANGSETLVLSCRSAFLPTETSDEVEIPYMNGKVFVAGKYFYESGSVTFNDYCDKSTANIIAAWRRLVGDPASGKVGLPSLYKKKAEVIAYSPDFSIERWWELYGIWPVTVNYGALDYSSSELVQIEVTFRYDHAIPHLDGYNVAAIAKMALGALNVL